MQSRFTNVDLRSGLGCKLHIILLNSLCEPWDKRIPGHSNIRSISVSISTVRVCVFGKNFAWLIVTFLNWIRATLSFRRARTAFRRSNAGFFDLILPHAPPHNRRCRTLTTAETSGFINNWWIKFADDMSNSRLRIFYRVEHSTTLIWSARIPPRSNDAIIAAFALTQGGQLFE